MLPTPIVEGNFCSINASRVFLLYKSIVAVKALFHAPRSIPILVILVFSHVTSLFGVFWASQVPLVCNLYSCLHQFLSILLFPISPIPNLSFRSFIFSTLKNFSLAMFQPIETDGKKALLLPGANMSLASFLKFAVSK